MDTSIEAFARDAVEAFEEYVNADGWDNLALALGRRKQDEEVPDVGPGR